MKRYYREFPQPDGSIAICEHDGEKRLPTRYVRAGEVAPKPQPRPTKPKHTSQPKDRPSPPPTNRVDCLHILEATGDSVEQKNCGCPGNKMTSVFECEIFGRVAPFAKGDPVDGVRACQKCGKYETLPVSAPAQ